MEKHYLLLVENVISCRFIIFIVYFGISYTGLKWIIVMAHWGFGLLILFKQTGDWLDG